jgi:hypothetical protein
MKKIVKIMFLYIPIFIVVLYIVCGFLGYKRVFLSSPDGSKTITFYNFFSNNKVYTIPYKYTNFLPPKDNYCTENIVSGRDSMWIKYINWYSNDGHYLKMTAECQINKLHDDIGDSVKYTNIVDYSNVHERDIENYKQGKTISKWHEDKHPLKYENYDMASLLKPWIFVVFFLITIFLIFIVEPILCLSLLLSLFFKKIGYWENNT